MKRIRFTDHALEQCAERGATQDEVYDAIRHGTRERAKKNRLPCRLNFQYNQLWNGEHYALKQVAPVIADQASEIVVVTVYTFYF